MSRVPSRARALLAGALLLPSSAVAQLSITPDVVYGHKDGMALTYDVLHPAGPANGAAVLYMVSGGWVSRWSPPETLAERPLFAELAARGFTTFLVRHGSSPRFKVPEAIADVRLAVEHVRRHAEDFGVDPARIGITGMSAGGHLSLSIGLRAEGADGSPEDPPAEREHQVAAIVAYFPPVDLRAMTGPNERFPALEFDRELADDASPILFTTSDDPPTLLLHGDQDRLVPLSHSERMLGALRERGVESELVIFEGAGHGFRGADAERGVRLTMDWFQRHLVVAPGSR